MNTNNKKFRKSTIVIPALALMVLTAGASATGAVAWFTATRQVEATASTFTAYSSTSDLTIATTKGQGTETDSTDAKKTGTVFVNTAKSAAPATANYLCDASYDVVHDKLYSAVLDDNGYVKSFSEITTKASDSSTEISYDTGRKTNEGSHEIFYAVNWTYTFTYKTTNPNGSALLFDLNSSFGGTSKKVSKGFRIAFRNATGSVYRVWSNTADNKTQYVDSAVTATTSVKDSSTVWSANYKEYTSPSVIQTVSDSTSRVADNTNASSVTSLPQYLGTFTTASTSREKTTAAVDTITLKCTAWYEGSDSAVVTENIEAGESLSADMKFYVRDLAA